MDPLQRRRLNWRQTPETGIADPDAAERFIAEAGIVSLYPASPEIPNLFHGHVGDPEAKTEASWDSPSGHVYQWRWKVGARAPGFYGLAVRKRPSWVSWALFPALLRLRDERRTPDELFDLGVLSPGAYRIVRALEEAGGMLSTAELRRAAGFPTGKEQRATYLRALAELDTRLLVGKLFAPGEDEMRHALVPVRFGAAVRAADALTMEAAADALLATYLPLSAFVAPAILAKHLTVDVEPLHAALERLRQTGRAVVGRVPGYTAECYLAG